jgi:hypothetical protein
VNLRVDNVILAPLAWNEETREWMEPAGDWGELRFCKAAPEAGAEWTDDGSVRDERQLKARAEGEWRRVPTAPPLTKLLRWQIKEFGPGPGGRIFLRGPWWPTCVHHLPPVLCAAYSRSRPRYCPFRPVPS